MMNDCQEERGTCFSDVDNGHRNVTIDSAPLALSKNAAQITAMVSNFSTSYNVINISLVLPILQSIFNVSDEEDATCASSLLAGMVLGQVLGGALGDSFLGRLGALRVVMAFQIVSSIGSALVPTTHLFSALAIWRFLLGIGAGGVYPLAAVLSAEQGDQAHAPRLEDETAEELRQQLHRVVIVFSMQGVGFLAVPLVTVPLLYATDNLDLVWRLVLGFGSLPGLLLVVLQYKLHRSSLQERHTVPVREPEEEQESDLPPEHGVIRESYSVSQIEHSEAETATVDEVVTHATSLWDFIKHEPQLGRKLVGTAGAWFLFDVLFYGNTLFQPIVMETAFGGGGGEDALRKVATDSLILSLIALPGYILSGILMGKRVCYITQTPRFVQMEGFVVMGMLYAIIGSYWSYLKRVPWLLVLLYGSTFFFANYGPNTTTFIFPSLVYSPECRSTLNGISAAAGKAGALLGATLFEPAARDFGDDKVMLICAGVSVLGFAITHFFVRLPPVSSEARGL
jgi:PHS family inorganic phosphate transporter-like MFS transporter